MSYLKDPRENSIRIEDGAILESDNRNEKRWRWGAQLLDLCNMSPDEYAKQIYNVSIQDPTSGSTKKEINVIDISFSTEKSFLTFYAKSHEPVKSDIYVNIKYNITDGYGNTHKNTTQIKIDQGKSEGEIGIDMDIAVKDIYALITIGLKPYETISQSCEDDYYKYETENINGKISNLYYGISPFTKNISDVDIDSLKSISEEHITNYPIGFEIPSGPGENAISQEQLDNETYNLLIVVESDDYQNLEIKDPLLGITINELFEEKIRKQIDGIEYLFLERNGKDEIYTHSEKQTIRYTITLKQ